MKIVLVAAEPAFRLGFKVAVEVTRAVEVVADAADARAGFLAVDIHKPDVVVMDLTLRGMNGIDATRELRRRAPRARVLLLAAWPCERDVLEGFAAGAHGFALKTDPIEILRIAIRSVGDGGHHVPSDVRGVTLESAVRAQRSRLAMEDEGPHDLLEASRRASAR